MFEEDCLRRGWARGGRGSLLEARLGEGRARIGRGRARIGRGRGESARL